MERKQVPADNVWISSTIGLDEAVGMVAEHLGDNAPNYYGRALLIPYKDEIYEDDSNLRAFASNGNVGSLRGKSGEPGGPVLAVIRELRLLEMAIKLADGQLLGVVEDKPGVVSGWVAATRALNLATGERDPGVPDEVHQLLMNLKREGNNGYPTPRKNSAYKTMVELFIGKLTAHGYNSNFVAGYLVASGVFGNSAENLQKIYR